MRKSLGLWDYFAIGFGAIIGTGWLLMVGDWIDLGGGPAPAMAAFALGALALVPIGAVFGELTSAIPASGGTVEYVGRAFGRRAAFAAGWLLALGDGILCPWESIALSCLAAEFLPAFKSHLLYTVDGEPVYLFTLLFSLAVSGYIAYMNHRGVQYAAWIQRWMTRILLGSMFAAIAVALVFGSPANLVPSRLPSPSVHGFWIALLPVLVMTPFFFTGFDTIPQQAEEAVESLDRSRLGRMIAVALLSSGAFYVAAIFAFGSLIPWKAFITYPVPALTVLDQVLGLTLFAKFMMFAAFCGIVTTLNAMFGATARILLAMARKGDLPEVFARLHPDHRTPVGGNLLLTVLTLAGPFFGKRLLVPLTNVCAFVYVLSCLMVCLAAFTLRLSEPGLVRPYRVPGGLAGIGAAILIATAILLLMAVPGSPSALSPVEWAIVLAWTLLGSTLFITRSHRTRVLD